MSPKDMALCGLFSLCLPVGQVLFKTAAIYSAKLDGPLPLKVIANPPLLGAFSWYGLTALFWFYILTRVPLSQAYVFSIVGSGLVPVLAFFVFKEPIGWRFVIGYALMLTGFTVIMLGNHRTA